MRQIRLLLSIALSAVLFATAAQAACRVEPRGVVPIDVPDGHLLVSVQVNEAPMTFVLDTGAERTLMGEDVVRRLGLERDGWVTSIMRGIGGVEEHPNALPRSLRLGTILLRRRTLTGDTSVTVGPLPTTAIAGRPIAGLLGRDFLSPFDLDIDLPNHRLTLYDVHGCDGAFLPWPTLYAAIPASTPMGAALVVQLLVDGRPLRALIDTGASASLITAPGMYRLGITPELLARDPGGNGSGVGPAPVPMYRHRFSELRVGPEVMRDPTLWVASVRVVPIVDMLLGADWLRSRHVWLSFATRQVFVAGGG
jgi:Aspartyl protease